jgi:5'-deoxynucleotidase YfbR-like HD superfamily hydrolase
MLRKQTKAFQIKIDTLKQMHDISEAITTALDRFDSIVQAFDKATAEALHEIIGNFVAPLSKCFQEYIETIQATAPHFILPLLKAN